MENRYDKFTALIFNISSYIQKIKNQEMTKMGLKASQVQCLFYLYNNKEGKSVTELCELCGEDKAAISRTVKDLTELEIVFCEKDLNKKYRNPIKLTEKGETIAQKICQKIDTIFDLGRHGVDKQNIQQFYEILTLVCDNLKNISDKNGEENGN